MRPSRELIIFMMAFAYALVIVLFNHFYRLPTKYFQLENKRVIDGLDEHLSKKYREDTKLNTKHYWNESLDPVVQDGIRELNREIMKKLPKGMVYIPSMTELYFSSKANQNSDQQYVLNHMDGPFYGCKVYRALVIIDGNKNIDTVYPDESLTANLKKYDTILFDYNNTPHYITVNSSPKDDTQRIMIKLHYAPASSHFCQMNHCKFSRQTRDLFDQNKVTLFVSGMISQTALRYNTHRKFILILVAGLIAAYMLSGNPILRVLLWLFVLIEVTGLVYTLHFELTTRKECVA